MQKEEPQAEGIARQHRSRVTLQTRCKAAYMSASWSTPPRQEFKHPCCCSCLHTPLGPEQLQWRALHDQPRHVMLLCLRFNPGPSVSPFPPLITRSSASSHTLGVAAPKLTTGSQGPWSLDTAVSCFGITVCTGRPQPQPNALAAVGSLLSPNKLCNFSSIVECCCEEAHQGLLSSNSSSCGTRRLLRGTMLLLRRRRRLSKDDRIWGFPHSNILV